MFRFFALLLICLVATACVSIPEVGSLSPIAAERQAHRDIASGHMRIYTAGTIAREEVGVKPEDRRFLYKIPRDDSLPSGCTIPHSSEIIGFAEAYNRVIIRYVRSHPQT